ncbi:MAG: ABC transporter permease [Nocardioidaceae bacterium]
MAGYIVRRLFSALLVVILTSMFVFALFFLGQTNVAANYCTNNGHCTAQKQAQITHELGLDQSVFSAYGVWAKGIFVGRKIQMGATYNCPAPCLGISYRTQQSITDILKTYFPPTLSIAIVGGFLYLGIGLVLGSLAARWRATVADKSLVTSSLLVSSIPYYLVVLLAYIYLYLVWGIFPQPGYTSPFQSPGAWVSGMLLAWLILGVTGSTNYARYSRGFMIDSLGEDYVRTATAKGVSRNKTIFKHALRVAVVPVITLFGIDFAYLLSGTVFTEWILGINGIGWYSLYSIQQQDFPVIQATVLVGAVFIVIANLLVDLLYSVLDPRVRLA